MNKRKGRHNPRITFGLADGRIVSAVECCAGCIHIVELPAEDAALLRYQLGEMLAELGRGQSMLPPSAAAGPSLHN